MDVSYSFFLGGKGESYGVSNNIEHLSVWHLNWHT
jgi:hypothetical protein